MLTPKVLTKAKERMIVLHPLPRIDEIRYGYKNIDNFEYSRVLLLGRRAGGWAPVLFADITNQA